MDKTHKHDEDNVAFRNFANAPKTSLSHAVDFTKRVTMVCLGVKAGR